MHKLSNWLTLVQTLGEGYDTLGLCVCLFFAAILGRSGGVSHKRFSLSRSSDSLDARRSSQCVLRAALLYVEVVAQEGYWSTQSTHLDAPLARPCREAKELGKYEACVNGEPAKN